MATWTWTAPNGATVARPYEAVDGALAGPFTWSAVPGGATARAHNPTGTLGDTAGTAWAAVQGARTQYGVLPDPSRLPALRGTMEDLGEAVWRIYVTPPSGERTEITTVRGAATTMGELTDTDPFAWGDTTLVFSGLSFFDRRGEGDLWWLVPTADVDIEWDGPLPAGYPYEKFAYEGYFEDFHEDEDGITVDVKGALYQVDNHQAKPMHLRQPISYETAIRNQWDLDDSLRVTKPTVVFPSWWTTRFDATNHPGLNAAFILTGTRSSELWTGMVTRDTGSFDDALTSYIQTLLGGMYTARGRWTLDLAPGRRTLLRHVDFNMNVTPDTVVIDPASPGVKLTIDELHSQSANVWYGQGKSLEGISYSGMEVSVDGERTRYKPLAALRQVEPSAVTNGWFQTERMRREQVLQAQEGLSAAQLAQVGAFQLRQFADPGMTGTITLKTDLRMAGGGLLPRWCLRAGMKAVLPGVHNTDLMVYVVKVSRNVGDKSVTVTYDSKFRDWLTVDQVRNKGRDALNVPRLLIGGQYTPPIEDQLVPWSYAEGSGYIPGGAGLSSQRLFDSMPDDIGFPWEGWTKRRPPKKAAWRNCYAHIGPASAVADNNWAYAPARGGTKLGLPIRMAQSATIRMLQIAAYDADGNVLPVPFHVSLYTSNGVNVGAMPKIPGPHSADGYPPGQRYPFFAGAWERYGADGTEISTEVTVPVSSAGFIKGWGTGRVKAGYFPAAGGSGARPTGMLSDSESFPIKAPTGDGTGDWGIDPFTTRQLSTYAGYLYLMIYCDAQNQDVYFAGRFWREEPSA